mmetsp:Transcript_52758/g.146233  ORF Transcript_52758/g.146233 Transcript_52758/m.146233 type:complete len:296 (+) Transcript_52758:1364-2251(+)
MLRGVRVSWCISQGDVVNSRLRIASRSFNVKRRRFESWSLSCICRAMRSRMESTVSTGRSPKAAPSVLLRRPFGRKRWSPSSGCAFSSRKTRRKRPKASERVDSCGPWGRSVPPEYPSKLSAAFRLSQLFSPNMSWEKSSIRCKEGSTGCSNSASSHLRSSLLCCLSSSSGAGLASMSSRIHCRSALARSLVRCHDPCCRAPETSSTCCLRCSLSMVVEDKPAKFTVKEVLLPWLSIAAKLRRRPRLKAAASGSGQSTSPTLPSLALPAPLLAATAVSCSICSSLMLSFNFSTRL